MSGFTEEEIQNPRRRVARRFVRVKLGACLLRNSRRMATQSWNWVEPPRVTPPPSHYDEASRPASDRPETHAKSDGLGPSLRRPAPFGRGLRFSRK